MERSFEQLKNISRRSSANGHCVTMHSHAVIIRHKTFGHDSPPSLQPDYFLPLRRPVLLDCRRRTFMAIVVRLNPVWTFDERIGPTATIRPKNVRTTPKGLLFSHPFPPDGLIIRTSTDSIRLLFWPLNVL